MVVGFERRQPYRLAKMSDRLPGVAPGHFDVAKAGMPVRAMPLVGVSYKSEEIAPPFGIDHDVCPRSPKSGWMLIKGINS
jgi:hypothetical protein